MKITRLIGTASEILNIFVQNATVTTGAGLAGIIASSVSAAWCRNDQAAASTVTMTSAASLGTFSSGGWKEVHTSFAIGWYQFGVPNGIFVSGRSALLHMYGAPSMAPLPIEIELTKTDNQTYSSSQPYNVGSILQSSPVTSAAGTLSVNQLTILGSTPVTSAAGRYGVNVQQLMGTAPVTSAAGIQSVNLRDVHGSETVTSAAGVVATALDWGRTANPNSTVAFSSVSFSSVPATVAGVNVTSVAGTAVVTSAAGVVATDIDLARILNATSTVSLSGLTVSSVLSPVNASSVTDKTGYRLDATGSAALTEGYAALGASGTLGQLIYEIRALLAEKSISGTTLTAKKLDGATTAETFTLDSATAPSSITRAS